MDGEEAKELAGGLAVEGCVLLGSLKLKAGDVLEKESVKQETQSGTPGRGQPRDVQILSLGFVSFFQMT